MTREEAIKQCEDFIQNRADWSVEAEWANGVQFVLEDYKRLIEQQPTAKNDVGVTSGTRKKLEKTRKNSKKLKKEEKESNYE